MSRDEDRAVPRSTAACSKAWRPAPVTVRTFDVDEDQLALAIGRRTARRRLGSPDEERGSRQGLRGLRLSLTRPELFQVQLRALLRAARHGPLRIMFPFVSSVEQVREARRMVAEAAADLARRGEHVPRGADRRR